MYITFQKFQNFDIYKINDIFLDIAFVDLNIVGYGCIVKFRVQNKIAIALFVFNNQKHTSEHR